MALATRCPACSTVFRISTAQAAAKGGMVRCGQCRNVFNSLDELLRVEDLDVIEEIVVDPAPPATSEAAGIEAEPADAPASIDPGPIEAIADAPRPPPAADDEPVVVEREAVFGEWWLPESEPSSTTGEPVADAEAALSVAPDDEARALSGRRTDLQWPAADAAVDDPGFMRPPATAAGSGTAARWTFGVLSLIATIALLAQGAYLWRDDIAVRWPATRPWLTAACARLDCAVGYPARPDAITIESSNITPVGTAANTYAMSALLRNRDTVDLRYPYLELALTDVQNRVVLRRTLRPEDYLPARAAAGGFAAGTELPIRVLFELSDLRFAGYRLDRYNP